MAKAISASGRRNPNAIRCGVVMPKLWVEKPARLVNSLRGSYGGILMVGVLTSLAGLLLGAFTFWEDRNNLAELRQLQVRAMVPSR